LLDIIFSSRNLKLKEFGGKLIFLGEPAC
jgi:hypothetical protein